MSQFVGDIAEQITDVIRFPVNIVGIVLGGYNRIRNAVMRPINALDLYSGNSVLSSSGQGGSGRLRLAPGTPARAVRMLREAGTAGDAVAIPPADTPENTQRAGNIVAANQLNGRLAATTAARVVAETDWAVAPGRRGRWPGCPGPDRSRAADGRADQRCRLQRLVALRAALSTDLRTRALAMPNLTEYTPQATLPAVVIAHRLYGDATRADEICVRNNVRHPGALRGGMALEVLSE